MIRSATLPLPLPEPPISAHDRLRLFSGSANVPLAQEVARYLGIDLGRWFASGLLMGNSTFKFKNRFGVAMFT